jgi:CspA family cold shock protein
MGEDGRMAVDAVVREWYSDRGWGVIDAAETPGGCWAHFGQVAITGYRELSPGQAVRLEWEPADQDGYRYRAVRVWPAGSDPVEDTVELDSAAYTSGLALHFDDQADD